MCGRIGGIVVIDKTFQVEVLKFLLFIEIIPFFQLFLFCLSDFAHSPGRTPEIPVGTIATGGRSGEIRA